MNEKHTIEQLQAMPDGELAELTARLRGLRSNGYGLLTAPDTGDVWRKHPASDSAAPTWNPRADIGQAYGLLVWLREQRIATYQIHGLTINPSIWIWRLKDETGFAVFGVDARAMVYAFVLAMQEVRNG